MAIPRRGRDSAASAVLSRTTFQTPVRDVPNTRVQRSERLCDVFFRLSAQLFFNCVCKVVDQGLTSFLARRAYGNAKITGPALSRAIKL